MENFEIYKTAKIGNYFKLKDPTKPGKYPNIYKYKAEFQIVPDSLKLKYRIGDIIKFNSLPGVPIYAKNNYAIVINRYRWVKHKTERTYCDYGTEILMLTGNKVGLKRRYFSMSPWKKIKKSDPDFKRLTQFAKTIEEELCLG